MKITDIPTNSVKIWKTKIISFLGEDSIRLFVRIFSVRLTEDLVDIIIVGQFDQKIFTVSPDVLFNVE